MLPTGMNPYDVIAKQQDIQKAVARHQQTDPASNPRYNRWLSGLGAWMVEQGERLEARHGELLPIERAQMARITR